MFFQAVDLLHYGSGGNEQAFCCLGKAAAVSHTGKNGKQRIEHGRFPFYEQNDYGPGSLDRYQPNVNAKITYRRFHVKERKRIMKSQGT